LGVTFRTLTYCIYRHTLKDRAWGTPTPTRNHPARFSGSRWRGENLKIWNPGKLCRRSGGQFFRFPVFQFPGRTGGGENLASASHRRHLGHDTAAIRESGQERPTSAHSGPLWAVPGTGMPPTSGRRPSPHAATVVQVRVNLSRHTDTTR